MSTTIDGSASVTINNGAVLGITSGTAVASTSGTSIDFTGIPSWAKRITVMFQGVSTSGTSKILVQLGSTTFTTTGYLGAANQTVNGSGVTGAVNSAGFFLDDTASASAIRYGNIVLTLITGNTWVEYATIARSDTSAVSISSGSIALSGTLDRVRITTVGSPPTDTFDAGTINIMYEG
jgi:hypothetical protein